MSNTEIWDKLGTTAPEHTKNFTRAGGFKGTAIRPIYAEHKMTELFGPCGIGWGISQPEFQLIHGTEGDIAVYCTVSVWYSHNEQASTHIPGVGGDFVVKKTQKGLISDDEAYKKAFTDALGNAMKHIGMSADVHMGQFEDSKYVESLKDNNKGTAYRSENDPNWKGPMKKTHLKTAVGDFVHALRGCTTADEFQEVVETNRAVIDQVKSEPTIQNWWFGQEGLNGMKQEIQNAAAVCEVDDEYVNKIVGDDNGF